METCGRAENKKVKIHNIRKSQGIVYKARDVYLQAYVGGVGGLSTK